MTDVEKRLWYLLRDRRLNGYKFRRQMPIGPYVADFVCLQSRLIVELDGGQHAEQAEKDKVRDEWLKSQGFVVLRFWNNDVLANTEGVLQAILGHCEKLPPHPYPRSAPHGSDCTPIRLRQREACLAKPCLRPARGEGNLRQSPARGEGNLRQSPAKGKGSSGQFPAGGDARAAASADRLRRLRWRCRRGLLELDLWLQRFADAGLDALSAEECGAFETLLQEADADLLAWLEGRQAVPVDHAAIIERIRASG